MFKRLTYVWWTYLGDVSENLLGLFASVYRAELFDMMQVTQREGSDGLVSPREILPLHVYLPSVLTRAATGHFQRGPSLKGIRDRKLLVSDLAWVPSTIPVAPQRSPLSFCLW